MLAWNTGSPESQLECSGHTYNPSILGRGVKAGDPEVQGHLLRESKTSLDYVRLRLKKNIKHLSLSFKKWEYCLSMG